MTELLAALGGSPLRSDPYPEWPVHDERDVEAVSEVVRSGQWGGFPYPRPSNGTLHSPLFQDAGRRAWPWLWPTEPSQWK